MHDSQSPESDIKRCTPPSRDEMEGQSMYEETLEGTKGDAQNLGSG